MSYLVLLGIFGLLVGFASLAQAIIKKQAKNRGLIIIGVSLFMIIGAAIATPTSPKIELTEKVIETNSKGVALIKGTTNEQSTIRIDDKKIAVKNETFAYSIQLKDKNAKKLTFVASINDKDKVATIEVKPSKEFLAFLDEKTQTAENLTKVKTALALAENEPTQKNYDEAATLVASLSRNQKEDQKRLAIVKEHIPIYTAVSLAEQEQTKETLDSATAFVEKATLNRADLAKRLTKLQQTITEKELVASAKAAVEQAEKDPTDKHYSQAIEKISALPNGSTAFSERINKVKQTIETQKEAAKQLAEAQKKAEAEAIAAQAEAEKAQNQAPAVGQTVLITPTGKKYHTYKCGNGDYFESTLAEAQSNGLTPCAKCY
ncbi:HlyD family secretion protein [Enterococcus rivorum]|uniref:Uncharacterized protein n=1 Tax=Enterococcus rivorum TaxID=762845 RepID=A0A1E5KXN8_9ENTE|nr:hypothetical protein [Enterococcus rivorum]MBP2099498.1 chemotaxis protein histidine kinase CheA [Enterococcus rivorum]OEH82626.1 hypothetical protein BCR26_12775 [Enterococcus rivorum]